MPLARHKHMLVAVSERLYTLHKTCNCPLLNEGGANYE